jgi:glutamate-1-semialdehyde aminotransferase
MREMTTQEQKAKAYAYLAKQVETLPREITEQIASAGGEDMLLSRIDILHWVYFTQEEVDRYREAIRLLEGKENIDYKLVEAAVQHNKDRYQSAMCEMIRLKKEISVLKQELQEHEKKLPYYSLVADVLEDELESRHALNLS